MSKELKLIELSQKPEKFNTKKWNNSTSNNKENEANRTNIRGRSKSRNRSKSRKMKRRGSNLSTHSTKSIIKVDRVPFSQIRNPKLVKEDKERRWKKIEQSKKEMMSDQEIDYQQTRRQAYLKLIPVLNMINHSCTKISKLETENNGTVSGLYFLKWQMSIKDVVVDYLPGKDLNPAIIHMAKRRAKHLRIERRWPALSLTKGQLHYERQYLDFRRQQFFKRRSRLLLTAIMRRSGQKLRVLKVVAFYKLISSVVLMNCTENSESPNSKFQDFYSKIQDQQVQKQGKLSRLQMIDREREQRKKGVVAVKRLAALRLMTTFKGVHKKGLSRSFFRWYRTASEINLQCVLDEFENVNIILSERAFREKVFRTKIRVLQNQIENEIVKFQGVTSSIKDGQPKSRYDFYINDDDNHNNDNE